MRGNHWQRVNETLTGRVKMMTAALRSRRLFAIRAPRFPAPQMA
jgi:hypothetical protein